MDREQQPKKEDIASRLLNRFFRRSSRRTKSTAPAVAVEEQPTVPEASASAVPPQPAQQPQTSTAPVAASTTIEPGPTPPIQWTDIQQERARALFAKYGLTLESSEWMTPRTLEVRRVDKPIRMRVRRTCHRCQTTFGPEKVCVNCQHVRCKQCPRYPPARTKEEKEARALAKTQAKTEVSPEGAAAEKSKEHKRAHLTMPSRTGGQDLIYKNINQRVRRKCHRCQTLFQGLPTQCENCGHVRCKTCPRDPSKLEKHPDGYPDDEDPPPERPTRTWKKPRMRVRYFCHKCDTIYIPGEPICTNCGQEKGPETRRDPPKKVKPPIDPDVVKQVQERLGAIKLQGIQAKEGDET